MIWNEPNNLSHWDFEIDKGWTTFAALTTAASAVRRASSWKHQCWNRVAPIR